MFWALPSLLSSAFQWIISSNDETIEIKQEQSYQPKVTKIVFYFALVSFQAALSSDATICSTKRIHRNSAFSFKFPVLFPLLFISISANQFKYYSFHFVLFSLPRFHSAQLADTFHLETASTRRSAIPKTAKLIRLMVFLRSNFLFCVL